MVRLEPYPPQFLKFGHVPPHPFQTMIEKNKIMILCSICTLIFVSGGKGGCAACHMHLCQLKSPRGGRLDGFYFCLSFRRVYFWARKSQEKLDTQIRASPVTQAQKALLKLHHTAKGASTLSKELNAQISPRTDDEYNLLYHEDELQEH